MATKRNVERWGVWSFASASPKTPYGRPLERADSVHLTWDAADRAARRLRGAGAEVHPCNRHGLALNDNEARQQEEADVVREYGP